MLQIAVKLLTNLWTAFPFQKNRRALTVTVHKWDIITWSSSFAYGRVGKLSINHNMQIHHCGGWVFPRSNRSNLVEFTQYQFEKRHQNVERNFYNKVHVLHFRFDCYLIELSWKWGGGSYWRLVACPMIVP